MNLLKRSNPRSLGRNAIFACTLLALVAVYLAEPACAADHTSLDQFEAHIGYMLRVTARLAFAAFLIAYIARPWFQLTGKGRKLMSLRRYFGLSMAFTHTVHFGYVVALVVTFPEERDPATLIGGGFVYLVIWAMALTSTNAAQRKLKRWWHRLHSFGMHFLWLVFVTSFGSTALANGEDLYAWLSAAALVAFGLRLASALNQRLSRTA